MRHTVKGRAFPISAKQLKEYQELRPNPIGVTTITEVNGRGSYQSAREAAHGRNKAERHQRAKQVLGSNMKRNPTVKHKGKILHGAAATAVLKSKHAKRRSRLAAVIPFGEKLPTNFRKVRRAPKPGERGFIGPLPQRRKRTTTSFRRTRAPSPGEAGFIGPMLPTAGEAGFIGPVPAPPSGKSWRRLKSGRYVLTKATVKRGKKRGPSKRAPKRPASRQYATIPMKRRVKRVVNIVAPRNVRVAFGKYPRARLYNAMTNRREMSYMYMGRDGKLHKIPYKTLTGKKTGVRGGADQVEKMRSSASKRIERRGGPFVPNAANSAKKRRHAKRLGIYRTLTCKGVSKTRAAATAIHYVPLQGSDTFVGHTKAGARMTANRKGSYEMNKSKRRPSKRAKKTTIVRGKRGKRLYGAAAKARLKKQRAAGGRSARQTKRSSARKSTSIAKLLRASAPKRRKTARKTARKTTRRSKSRRSSMRRNSAVGEFFAYTPNRRRRSSRRRSRGFTMNGFLRNPKKGFMQALTMFLKYGGFAAGGFLLHRGLTNLLCIQVMDGMLLKPGADGTVNQTLVKLKPYDKLIFGSLVLAAGLPLSSMLGKAISKKDQNVTYSLGAGMVASLFQSAIVQLLGLSSSTAPYANYLSGYQQAAAGYAVRGHKESIMPEYAPLGEYFQANGLGFTQAAAGFTQAAAGFQQAAAGMGEYFQANGMGEYFAPNGVQGVGHYEPAGPLARTGMGEPEIDDGIRPENAERMLMLAESAAGVGMGEFFTASPQNGGYTESTVPTDSQWIPNGPLWAGTMTVDNSKTDTTLPAGVLANVGGNGILSAAG
jgi:hypothetical protein